jgi:hypothetical protein
MIATVFGIAIGYGVWNGALGELSVEFPGFCGQ